jgi:hypothetical protein
MMMKFLPAKNALNQKRKKKKKHCGSEDETSRFPLATERVEWGIRCWRLASSWRLSSRKQELSRIVKKQHPHQKNQPKLFIRTLFYSAHIHTIESSRRLADILACSQKVSHPGMRLVWCCL